MVFTLVNLFAHHPVTAIPRQQVANKVGSRNIAKKSSKKLFSKRAIVNGNQIQKPAQSELFHIFVGEE